MDNNIKYAIYLRKSTEEKDRQVRSIESQMHELQGLASDLNLNIIQTIEEEKSARIPNNRPKFAKLITDIKQGKVTGLLVWETSRISRNPQDSGIIQQLLQDGKLKKIRSMTREFNPEDNAILFSIESAVAAQYSIELRARARRGYRSKVRNGQLSGIAPEGYLNDKSNQTIIKDPVRFPLVRRIFDMYLQGYTVSEIKMMLDEAGYRTIKRKKRGGNLMGRSTIYHILANPRYCGKIPHPDHPDDPARMYDAKFPKMITEEEYERVQLILGTKGRTKYVTKKEFELRGLLKCGECTCSVTAERKSKQLKNGGINFHTYYHCTHKRPCQQKGVTEANLFETIDGLLDAYQLTPGLYEWGLRALDRVAKEEINLRSESQKLQSASIEALEAKLSKLMDLLSDDIISTEDYQRKSEEIKKELAIRKDEKKASYERAKNWYEIVGNVLSKLSDAQTNFRNGDYIKRKDIIDAIGYNAVLLDQKFEITVYEWLKPLISSVDLLKKLEQKVITEQDTPFQSVNSTKKSPEEDVLSTWQGY